MASVAIIRYPSGEREFRSIDDAPTRGDTLKGNGEAWEVTDVALQPDGPVIVTVRQLSAEPVLVDPFSGASPEAAPAS